MQNTEHPAATIKRDQLKEAPMQTTRSTAADTQTAQHTPGPWTAWMDHKGTESSGVNGPNGNQICRTRKPANARLIAAAPDLLRALKDFVYSYEDDSATPRDFEARMEAVIDSAIAAIDKAEAR